MKFTIFGIIWIVILFLATLQGKKRLQECVIVSCLFQAGAVILLESASVPPVAFSCVYYIIYHIISSKGNVKFFVSKHNKLLYTFVVIIMLSSLIASFFFVGLEYLASTDWIEYIKYDGNIPIYGISLVLVYIITMTLFEQDNEFNNDDLHHILIVISIIVFIIGIWQYLSIMKVIPRNDFIQSLIYSNANSKISIAYYVDTNINIYKSLFNIRFYSSFMEPSYCSGFLIMCYTYFLSIDSKRWIDYICLSLIVLMIVLTFSVTAYASFAIASFLVAIANKSIKKFLKISGQILILLGLFALIVRLLNIWDVIERIVLNKLTSHSGVTRSQWNENCFNVFFQTFGIGLGFGNIRGSGLFQTLIGSFGVMGTVFFSSSMVSLVKSKIRVRYEEEKTYSRMIGIMIISVLICQLIAIPTIDYTILWMVLFVSSLSNGNDRRKRKCLQSTIF